MTTFIKDHLAVTAAAMFLFLSACHSRQKDSSTVADSANQQAISRTDSANKAETGNYKKLEEDASKFLVKSYEAGMYEIQLSQLAATNASDGDVKGLAAELVATHGAMNDKISSIAKAVNFVLPVDLNSGHKNDLNNLTKVTGADFDKKYIDYIVSGHETAVSDYKDAYKNLKPGNTQTFAANALPQIEDHLAAAKKVKDRIK